MSTKRCSIFAIAVVVFSCAIARGQFTFTTLKGPSGASTSSARGISGNNVVGYYTDKAGKIHGFEYNGASYTSLNVPLASGAQGTQAYGISGNTVVGYSQDAAGIIHGFKYDGTTYTTLNNPNTTFDTQARGISGNTIVGSYVDQNNLSHGFAFDGQTYTTIDDPLGATGTQVNGIDGDVMAGLYQDKGGAHGFTYNRKTFVYTTIDVPTRYHYTTGFGVSGANFVGGYDARVGTDSNGFGIYAAEGFVYDGSTYTTLSDPLADSTGGFGTYGYGISGDTVVGDYNETYNVTRGYIVTIPEPSSIWVAGMIACALAGRRRWLRRVRAAGL